MDSDELIEKSVIEIAGLQDASLEDQQEFVADTAALVLVNLTQKIRQKLADGERAEFDALFGGNPTNEEKVAFLEKCAPDFGELLVAETLLFKKALIGFMAEHEKKILDEK